MQKGPFASANPIEVAWSDVIHAAEGVSKVREQVPRLANLAVIAALAFRTGLIPNKRQKWSGPTLQSTLQKIALGPLPKTSASIEAWSKLAQLSGNAADIIETTDGLLHFAALCQFGDPNGDRKSRGSYPTPPSFAKEVARLTLGTFSNSKIPPLIIDPSAGAGVLLIAALRQLGSSACPDELRLIVYGLNGIEVDPNSRELCCLLLWVGAARARPRLQTIARNIHLDNAITRNWWSKGRPLFDALLMNPPWESLRHTTSGCQTEVAIRAETVARLSRQEDVVSDLPPLFSAQGRGDRNLFKGFVELAPYLLRSGGRIGALIPAAFSSDLGMAPLRARYFEQFDLERWTAFENLQRHFPIDGRYKFGILVGTRSSTGTKRLRVRSFATQPHEVDAKHISLDMKTIRRLGGEHCMLPELRDEDEATIASHILSNGTAFFDKGSLGEVLYQRELDLTLDRKSNKIQRIESLDKLQFRKTGWHSPRTKTSYVPVVEGRMVGRYDVFQKSWVSGSGRTAEWKENHLEPLQKCRPQFVTEQNQVRRFRVAICDVSSATNARTVRATLVPEPWVCGNTAPVLLFSNEQFALAGLAVLNSMVFDWIARRVISGLHLNKFYLATLVWPRLSHEAIARLSLLAATLLRRSPRITPCISKLASYRAVGPLDGTADLFKKVEADVEREVAIGFNLPKHMLEHMLSSDRNDRRGFWRYFASHPRAFEAVRAMLEAYDASTPTRAVA